MAQRPRPCTLLALLALISVDHLRGGLPGRLIVGLHAIDDVFTMGLPVAVVAVAVSSGDICRIELFFFVVIFQVPLMCIHVVSDSVPPNSWGRELVQTSWGRELVQTRFNSSSNAIASSITSEVRVQA